MKKYIAVATVTLCALFALQTDAATYQNGDLLTSPQHTSVYEYKDGKRHGFVNAEVFHTWYADFSKVKTISVSELEAIELGTPMPVKENTKLIKFPLNPKTYAVTSYATIQHIPDEETAIALFGANWASNIIELPEIYFLFYTKGPALEQQEAPIEPPETTSVLEVADCPAQFEPYVNTEHQFVLCLQDGMEVKPNGDQWGFYGTDGMLKGDIAIVDSYDTLDAYVDATLNTSNLMGGTYLNEAQALWTTFDTGGGGIMLEVAAIQNNVNKEILVLSFIKDDGPDYYYSIGRRAYFYQEGAQVVHPYVQSTSFGQCDTGGSEWNMITRLLDPDDYAFSYGYYNVEKFSFCYDKSYTMTVNNGPAIDLDVPFDGLDGAYVSHSVQNDETIDSLINIIETDSDITGVTTQTTDHGDTMVTYTMLEPGHPGDEFRIDVMRNGSDEFGNATVRKVAVVFSAPSLDANMTHMQTFANVVKQTFMFK